MRRVHLVDGTYELYRAHYSGRPGHRTPDGRERKAVVGLTASLLGLLSSSGEAVTHVAVAFDNPIASFRNDLFDGYKSDAGVPPDLRAQFDDAEEAVRAIGIVVWSMKELEADDAIATGAKRFAPTVNAQVDQVRILSPDKDFGQCLDDARVVMVDRMRDKVIDEDAYFAKVGVRPASVPDFLALVGDTADGIPGVPGIGEKTAAALLSTYGHLEAIPANASDWSVKPRGAEAAARAIGAHREEALLWRRLATLVTDAPLRESLDDLRFAGVPRERFESWCDALGVRDLRERGLRLAVST
jgi:5'-3' exonuclease